MAISASHVFGCMANKIVDDSLVDAGTGEITDKAMAKAVPAFDVLPAAVLESLSKM